MDTDKRHAVDSAAEQAVRAYLVALQDPSSLMDDAEVQRLRHDLARIHDPLERLKTRARLEERRRCLAERAEAGFVACAKPWADAQDVTAEAFRAEGVPAAVLRRAGFSLREDQRRRPRRRPRPTATRPSVSDIRAAIPHTGTFTLADIQDQTRAPEAAVRRVVRLMIARGEVEDLEEGRDDADDAQGRRVYRRRP